MKAFKFIVREWTNVPSRPGCQVNTCAALVFAKDVDEARELLRVRNVENSSLPWEEVATVIEVSMDRAHVALLVEA
jgi:hypothetical protein